MGLLAWALFAAEHPPVAQAGLNDNVNDCRGYLRKGEPSQLDPEATVIKYTIACAQPITGFQLQSDHAVTSFETEVFGIDRLTKQVVPTDAFSCQGGQPGYGINCVMAAAGTSYSGNYNNLTGTFEIDEKLCAEPRIDVLLSVVNATLNSANKIVQAISGPYELGRPRGCPKSARGGKTRIPREKEESTIQEAPPETG